MPRQPTGRPPGAPPNNRNHLTHGLYSRHMSVQVSDDVASMSADQNRDELALTRARLDRVLDLQRDAPPGDWLAYEKFVAQYLQQISTLLHANAVLGRDSRTSFVTVMEMIRQINEEQGSH